MISKKITLAIFLFSFFLNAHSVKPYIKRYKKDKMEIFDETEIKKDSLMLDSLLAVKKMGFINRPVDSFLTNAVICKYHDYSFIDLKPGMLSYLSLKFADNIFIEVQVKKYEYLEPFDIKRSWDISLFKKEKISEIRVFYNDKYVEIVN